MMKTILKMARPKNYKNPRMESVRYLLLFIWTLNVMDGFKTSRHITLSGLAAALRGRSKGMPAIRIT